MTTKVLYKDKDKISILGVILRDRDNEIESTFNIKDKVNSHKVLTLYKDIKEGDLIIVDKKNYKVILVNEHLSLGYIACYIAEAEVNID